MELKRSLGLFDAFAIGLGAVIGAGIFVVIGVAASLAGPAMLLSLLIAGVVSALTAISFVHLARFIPREGGGYEYAHELVSPFGGFISGWMWLLSNIVTGSAVALGFAGYLAIYIPLPVNLMAAVACLAITGINYMGSRESATANNILVVFKLVVLLLFVAFGLSLINGAFFSPFAASGAMGVMEGAAVIFFAFSGFGRVAMISEEVRDPTRTVPRAIILALAVSGVIYMLVAVVAIGMFGSASLGASNSPLADAAALEGKVMANLVTIGALAATLSVLLTTLLGLSRITFAMSRNHDLPAVLSKLHPKRQTPYIAILVFGLLMTAFALTTDILKAVAISNFGSLVYYLIANLAAMRIAKPRRAKVLPILGLVSCAGLLVFLTTDAWLLGIGALVVGAGYYYLYPRRKHGSSTKAASRGA
jgi:APA family basic amino acid/polyamine antiporter